VDSSAEQVVFTCGLDAITALIAHRLKYSLIWLSSTHRLQTCARESETRGSLSGKSLNLRCKIMHALDAYKVYVTVNHYFGSWYFERCHHLVVLRCYGRPME